MLDGNDRYEPLCGGSDQVPISPCDAPRTSAPPPRSPDCHSRNSSSCASAWPACLHLGVTVTVRSGQLVWSMDMVKTPFCSARSQCSGCCGALRLDHFGVNFSLIKLTPARDYHCPALCPCASPLASRVSTPNHDTSHTLLLGSFRGTPHRSPQPACSSLCAGSRGTKARARRHLQRVGRLRVSLDRGGAYCA